MNKPRLLAGAALLLHVAAGYAAGPPAAIQGGLGYDFSITMEAARATGMSVRPNPGSLAWITLTKAVPQETFQEHRLLFTEGTRELFVIEGSRQYRKGGERNPAACTEDAIAIRRGIDQKYPGLERVVAMGEVQLCDAWRPADPLIGQVCTGRSVTIRCTGEPWEETRTLVITYTDHRRQEEAVPQSERLKIERAQEELRSRGLDKFKL